MFLNFIFHLNLAAYLYVLVLFSANAHKKKNAAKIPDYLSVFLFYSTEYETETTEKITMVFEKNHVARSVFENLRRRG